MRVKTLLFSAQGRIGRGLFWGGTLGLLVPLVAVAVPLSLLADKPEGDLTPVQIVGIAAAVVITLLFSWCNICLAIKRLHDRNRSGWWYLISFVPYIGSLILFVECGILRGTRGTNRYGADPRGAFREDVVRAFDGPQVT